MKKIGLLMVAACLSLSLTAFGGNQPKTERPASRSKAEQPKAQKTPQEGKAVRGAESAQALNSQIAQLKQEHQAAMSELEAIKKLAAEEKATKTLGALDKLIARRNQDFQQRLNPLQQRLSKLEAQGKGGDKDKDRPSDDKGKTNGDKGKPKGKSKGTTSSKEQ